MSAIPVTSCPYCGEPVHERTSKCVFCGRVVEGILVARAAPTPASRTHPWSAPASADELAPYFPVALWKFALLSFCTLGLYQLYWSYENWSRIQARTGERMSPFWRAFFLAIWSFVLFTRIGADARSRGVRLPWNGLALAALQLAMMNGWQFGAPWAVIAFFSFLASLPVVATTNAINATVENREPPNTRLTQLNLAAVLLGGTVVVTVIVAILTGKTTI